MALWQQGLNVILVECWQILQHSTWEHKRILHFWVRSSFLELILVRLVLLYDNWAAVANALVQRECFLMQHLWWIWLKPSKNYHSIFQSAISVYRYWKVKRLLLVTVIKCCVVTYRGTPYHMPGVWVLIPPACSNTLTVLSSLPRHFNTPCLEWINRLAAKYYCYLSFKSFFRSWLLFSLLLHAPLIIQTSGFAPLQVTFCSTIFPPLLSSCIRLSLFTLYLFLYPLDLQLSVKFHPGGCCAWINQSWLAFGLSAPSVIDFPR